MSAEKRERAVLAPSHGPHEDSIFSASRTRLLTAQVAKHMANIATTHRAVHALASASGILMPMETGTSHSTPRTQKVTHTIPNRPRCNGTSLVTNCALVVGMQNVTAAQTRMSLQHSNVPERQLPDGMLSYWTLAMRADAAMQRVVAADAAMQSCRRR